MLIDHATHDIFVLLTYSHSHVFVLSLRRERLTEFYRKYNPKKLNTVDAVLEAYRGKEEKLFQQLEAKYTMSKKEKKRMRKKYTFEDPEDGIYPSVIAGLKDLYMVISTYVFACLFLKIDACSYANISALLQ